MDNLSTFLPLSPWAARSAGVDMKAAPLPSIVALLLSSGPSVFDLLMLEKFTGTIQPAVGYLLDRVLAPAFPSLSKLFTEYKDELQALLLLQLQQLCLNVSGAAGGGSSIELAAYGWTQLPLHASQAQAEEGMRGLLRTLLHPPSHVPLLLSEKGNASSPIASLHLSSWSKAMLLLGQVGVPYLLGKLAKWQTEGVEGVQGGVDGAVQPAGAGRPDTDATAAPAVGRQTGMEAEQQEAEEGESPASSPPSLISSLLRCVLSLLSKLLPLLRRLLQSPAAASEKLLQALRGACRRWGQQLQAAGRALSLAWFLAYGLRMTPFPSLWHGLAGCVVVPGEGLAVLQGRLGERGILGAQGRDASHGEGGEKGGGGGGSGLLLPMRSILSLDSALTVAR